MIASSTSSASAITRAPSEVLCRLIWNTFMVRKVAASTSGIDSATTMPVRQPRLMKETASTMPMASSNESTNTLMKYSTCFGWSATV